MANVENAADVGMGDLAGETDLVAQASQGDFVLGDRSREKLESDQLPQFQIVSAIDLAHASASQQFDDAVTLSEDSTRKKTTVDCVVVRSSSRSVATAGGKFLQLQ
jgi:hypothetical protein